MPIKPSYKKSRLINDARIKKLKSQIKYEMEEILNIKRLLKIKKKSMYHQNNFILIVIFGLE